MAKVHSKSLGKYQVLLNTEHHAILADEPKDIGDGLGPDPYELLLSALGACITMTLHMYARRKQWDLRRVELDLDHAKIHARDCEDCEQTSGFVDKMHVKVSLEGDLDESQRARLLEIAGKCPVRKTLLGMPRITEELV